MMTKLDLNWLNSNEVSPFMNMSACWCKAGIWKTRTSSFATFPQTKWMSISTYFVCWCCTKFVKRYTAPLILSQNTKFSCERGQCRSSNILQSQHVSVTIMTLYSAFELERETVACIFEDHEISVSKRYSNLMWTAL